MGFTAGTPSIDHDEESVDDVHMFALPSGVDLKPGHTPQYVYNLLTTVTNPTPAQEDEFDHYLSYAGIDTWALNTKKALE